MDRSASPHLTGWRKRALLIVAVLVGVAGVLTASAHAYEVAPMRVFLEPARGQNAATITINNIRDEDLPVEIKVFRRLLDADGAQTFEPADDEFLVFPLQANIGPGRSQAVRFQYLGAAGDETEAFVVQVTEVPVNKLEATGIQFTYNFGVAVYVQPPRARPVIDLGEGRIKDGTLSFLLANRGNDFGFLIGQSLEYRIGNQWAVIAADALNELVQNPMFAPRSERMIEIPVAGLANAENVSLRLIGQGS